MLSSNAQSQAPARLPWMRAALLALACIGVLAAWYAVQARGPANPLQRQAEDYVRLALELGRLHPAEVDSYFGPAALDGRARGSGPALEELRQRTVTLLGAIRSGAGGEGAAPEAEARRARLIEKVEHLVRVLDLLAAPGALSFAEEARLLYGVALPTLDPQDFEAARQELEALLPGSGTLAFRLATFRNQAVVPGDKRQAVFERALEACRARSAEHWQLADKPLDLSWSADITAAWYRYEADGGKLTVNPLALAYVSEALEVACHEVWPGHHAQFALYHQDGLPVEDQVVLLRSPESALREAAAILAVDLAFPSAERLAFEAGTLYPLAGLSTEQTARQLRVHELLGEVADASIAVLLDYRDGDLGYNSATFRLEREALVASPEALLAFVDEYGAYSVSYTAARRALAAYLKEHEARGEDPWQLLGELLRHPEPRRVFGGATRERVLSAAD